MPLRLLYVMDPLSRVLIDKDTTFAFLLEGERRGHEQHHCGVEDLFVERSAAHARARPVRVRRAAIHYTLGDQRGLPLGAFDVVFMRKDPPFDLSYYFATQVLGLADPAVTLVVNDPRGLREANEKLYALHFPELVPESLEADGLYFVGLDVIGGLVTEVNVTSPTGVQEIDRLDGTCLEARVLDWVEARAARLERATAATARS